VRARGLLRGRRVAGLDCDSPLRLVMSCGWVWVKVCGRYGCAPCTVRARRRKARVVAEGMHVQDRDGRWLWLLTLTAPGERAHDRWTPAQLYRRGQLRDACDCHDGFDLAVWNPSAGACWNRLRTALSREVVADFYRATEVQEGHRGGRGRGALHHHVVIATTTRSLDVRAVQQLALAAGYGCVMDLRPVTREEDMGDVARYLAKTLAGYVTKGAGETRSEVPWKRPVADPETGEIRLMHTVATYRLSSQSKGWGCTERQVREVAREQARRRAAHLVGLPSLRAFNPPLDGSEEPLSADVATDP
jgi:hypothetical protein